MAGRLGTRSSFADDHHDSGDAGNVARQLRGRCNRACAAAAGSMSLGQKLACAILVLVLGASAAANWLAPAGYAKQYREATDAPPSHTHWLGTDELGRDRFARVLYGTRISLLLAPAAALFSTLMAAFIGGLAGYLGGGWGRIGMAVTDLFLSLPLVVSTDYSAGSNAVECFSLGFSAGDIPAIGITRLDDGGASAVQHRSGTAYFRFRSTGARRRPDQTKIVLDACRTEFKTSSLRSVLDLDSGLHLK